ncbi:MAG: protein kinase, partial [Oscillospiraceae bacterium]
MSGQRKLCLSCMCAVPSDAKSCPKCGYNGSQKNPEQCLPIGYRLCSKYVVGMHKSFDGDSCTYIGFDCTANTVVEIKEFLPHSGCSRDKQDGYSLRPTQDAELHYKTALMDFVELYRNLAKLSNEQTVIKVQDFFEANLTAYAVLETFNGVTLREFLDMMGGTIPFDKCMILLSPVLDALSRIHSVNLIHRGVSPETIFVNRNGDVKLGGYATSSVRTKDTEVAPKLFSGYSAPEQYSSTMWQSACTDVYGIAAVFYRCLTGVGPQDAEQRKSYDTLERPIALQSTIPQIVSRTIMMGMLVNTKERIQSTQDFKKMLNNEALPVTSKTKIVPTPKIPNESRTVKKTQLTTSKQSNNRIEKNKSPKPERTFPWVTFIVVSIAVIAVVGVMAYVGKQLLETLNPVTPDIDASQSGIEVPNYVGINMAELKYDRDN